MTDRRSSAGLNSEDPPNSRLFIIAPKNLNEDDFRKAFENFGNIEEIWVVKDRVTGDNKGVTYIKYSKTSEAAKALEAMNGKAIGSGGRSIKVMIAASRDQGSKRDANEEEKMQRLFLIVPKHMTDSELYDYFKQFGEIDYASVIKDKNTRDSKGVAYVKFMKFSHAAAAFEQCDRKYKPVFAEPRKSRNEERNFSYGFDSFNKSMSSNSMPPMPVDHSMNLNNASNEGYTKLTVIASPMVNQDQLWKLFDIVPGMDYCQLRYDGDRMRPSRAVAEVVYSSPQWASHAKDKLHGFEYPPGNRLIVKPDYDGIKAGISKDKTRPDILQIAETIAQASSLIQAAGLSPELLQAKLNFATASKQNENFCSVSLPEKQPLASNDDPTASRCFIVCIPSALPNPILRDVFCRFGNLIDVYMLSNRNCGYAKYATKESAERAINTLHGAEVAGVRLKVMEAEEKTENYRKRQRMDAESPF